jgi:hypothetical protein
VPAPLEQHAGIDTMLARHAQLEVGRIVRPPLACGCRKWKVCS